MEVDEPGEVCDGPGWDGKAGIFSRPGVGSRPGRVGLFEEAQTGAGPAARADMCGRETPGVSKLFRSVSSMR